MSKDYTAYPWTHRSAFQKTELFQSVHFKHCVAAGAPILSPDPDDDLCGSERAAKRRRVEAAAQRIIDGEALVIASAPLCPRFRESVRDWIARTHPTLDISHFRLDHSEHATALWEDVEDDEELLERLASKALYENHTSNLAELDLRSVASEKVRLSSRSRAHSRAALNRTGDAQSMESSHVSGTEQAVKDSRSKQRSLRARRSVSRRGQKAALDTYQAEVLTPVEETSYVSQNLNEVRQHDLHNNDGRRSGPGDEDQVDKASNEKASYHTAPELHNTNREPADSCAQPDSEEGAQARVMITPARSDSGRGIPQPSNAIQDGRESPELLLRASTVPEGSMEALCGGAERHTYVTAQPSQLGSTPFMFRKPTTKSHGQNVGQEHDTTEKPKKARRKVLFPSSDSTINAAHAPDTAAGLPSLDKSLVEEHLNTVLPRNEQESGKTSSVKKAIRRELRNSGAEITRCASEPRSSPVAEERQHNILCDIACADTETCEDLGAAKLRKDLLPSQLWPGTQMMLARAQHDLTESPEKGNESNASVRPSVSPEAPRQGWTAINDQRSVDQTSPHELPNTQALLNDFAGFSTTKKPRQALRKSMEPTPTARNSASRREGTEPPRNSKLHFSTDHDQSNLGRSSLRFSMVSHDSPTVLRTDEPSHPYVIPVQSLGKDIFTMDDAFTPFRPTLSRGESQLQTAQPILATGQESFEPTTFSSFQAAQKWSSFRDDSSLRDVIEELTTNVLDTGDVDGVLSPVA